MLALEELSLEESLSDRDETSISIGFGNETNNQWSAKYDRESMTFMGKIQSKNIDVLIDTGSFVTLIDEKVLTGLRNIRR